MSYRTVLSFGDTHCGHLGGLTPPSYQIPLTCDGGKRDRIALLQRELWDFHKKKICCVQPDILILGGDLVDGKQAKAEGEDIWSTRRRDQVDAAIACIRPLVGKNTKVFGVAGTRYHTQGDWENEILEEFDAELVSQSYLEIGGMVFDIRHKTGLANAPSSRPQIKNDWLHSLIWNAHGDGPKTDVIVRHHAHTYYHEGDGAYLAIVVPGMQWFSEYGELNINRWIACGAVKFMVSTTRKELPLWTPIIAKLESAAVPLLQV